MNKAFVFRLYPTSAQLTALEQMLDAHRLLYNCALQHRRDAYRQRGLSVRYGQQSAELRGIRADDPRTAALNFSSLQATLRHLDRSFQAFFRRVKSGDAPGYPRFKGRNRFRTVTFPSVGDGCGWSGSHVRLQAIGLVKVKQHRPIKGQIKTISVTARPDGWHVILTCDVSAQVISPSTNPSVGIDLDLTSFIATSDGEVVRPPKHYRTAQRKLRRLQRCVARRKRGSRRRTKAVANLRKLHGHIANQRKDWQHKTALALVQRAGCIVHEDIDIRGIARSRLAKSTHDAAWAAFLTLVRYKAANAGVRVIAVNPAFTSQACSECGCLPDVPKTLAVRLHVCGACGYTADRDINTARNILAKGLGLSLQASTPAMVGVA